jgi:hypothetical protein
MMKRTWLTLACLGALALVCTACSGDDGKDGAEGPEGPAGPAGEDGNDGTPGADGTDGDDGARGPAGADGADGDEGPRGSMGEAGPMGAMGDPGASGVLNLTELTGNVEVYALDALAGSGITGIVRFAELEDGATLVTVKLDATGGDDAIHPSHIHVNSLVEGGAPAVTLNPIDGITGISETVVTEVGSGTPITYEELIEFDGYVNVHVSPMDGAAVAGGDIGGNALTGETLEYELLAAGAMGIVGKATIAERRNGNTLITLEVTPSPGTDHVAHVHDSDWVTGGPPVIDLSNVDGDTGISQTHVETLNDMTEITYDDFADIDAYINVHVDDQGGAAISQGDIGGNALTGASISYVMAEANASGVTGVARFEERENGFTLLSLELDGTMDGGDHPAHIHMNDVASGGPPIITLANTAGVTGDTAISRNSVRALDDTTAITYDELLALDAHVNVHTSPTVGDVVCEADIGSNGP